MTSGKSIMDLSDNEEDTRDYDNDESLHQGLDSAEEVVEIDKSDSEVDAPARREHGIEIDRQISEYLVKVASDELENYNAAKMKITNRKRKKIQPVLMWQVWEVETEKWIDQHMREDTTVDNLNEIRAETADPPQDFVMPLLRYQKEGLAWGIKQEESPSRGGILADEMGMGKTVQAIALVLARRAICHERSEPSDLASGSSTGLPCVKATLVICPPIAVMQWANEIDRFTTKGSNKVLVYHGPNRGKTFSEVSGYDFVITTYSVVEGEHRKSIMPPKESCNWCGKKFYERALKTHVSHYCKVKRYGEKRPSSSKENVDKKKASKKCTKEKLETGGVKSLLHFVKWTRIILDEAHYIKNRHSSTAKAVFALESSYRWALSGTPLQNFVNEFYSIVHFLRVTPYSYYFCIDCDCKVLKYATNTPCPGCPHGSVRHFCWWKKYIAYPISSNDRGERARATILLKDKVLKCLLLRRTKKDRAADLALPPRTITQRRDYLDITEKDCYASLQQNSRGHFDTYVNEGTLQNNTTEVFNMLRRLQQAADHPYLVLCSKFAVASSSKRKHSDEQFCGLCDELAEDPLVTSCEHLFSKSCLVNFSACPTCSNPLRVDFSANNQQSEKAKSSSILNRINLANFKTSTKIEALKEEIRLMVERDGSAKGIVFSQFSQFLELIGYSLLKSGVKCVQLHGSMTMTDREAAITRFKNDGDCRIFLMSLKAGGVALNLMVASHVFLMDPCWNPAVEQQAQDRIHRIGQYKPIRIVRFITENTIEDDILQIQETRKLAFDGIVDGCKEAFGKLSPHDLGNLFRSYK